jgi:hypothetical protein
MLRVLNPTYVSLPRAESRRLRVSRHLLNPRFLKDRAAPLVHAFVCTPLPWRALSLALHTRAAASCYDLLHSLTHHSRLSNPQARASFIPRVGFVGFAVPMQVTAQVATGGGGGHPTSPGAAAAPTPVTPGAAVSCAPTPPGPLVGHAAANPTRLPKSRTTDLAALPARHTRSRVRSGGAVPPVDATPQRAEAEAPSCSQPMSSQMDDFSQQVGAVLSCSVTC